MHDLMTPNEVAKLLRVSLRSVYRWIRRGQIGFLEREAGAGVRYLIPRSAALAKLHRREPPQVLLPVDLSRLPTTVRLRAY